MYVIAKARAVVFTRTRYSRNTGACEIKQDELGFGSMLLSGLSWQDFSGEELKCGRRTFPHAFGERTY